MLNLLKDSKRSQCILVTLKALNAEGYQINTVDAEPEYILEKDGKKLNNAYDVLKCLCAESPLYGTLDAEKKALVDTWLEFCDKELEVPLSVLVWLASGLLSREQVNTVAEKKARSDIMLLLRRMELRLKESPFFAGEEMSLADITIACCLRPLMMTVLGEVERKNFPSVCAWMEKMFSSALFLETVGETVMLVSAKKGKKKN
ncbi:elongation factor 1-gamma [Blastocystis sp. ATCC 50177/Nand II]|uniref:Elongation factor 1-gamma n=1 Tax=Blastocystis sp. subtype 1 (strain ATCC 50177 / NandII) TaxID=478820 RepID=A0A196SPD4_BLAHN|nr:elongation factor 1-gamma [Blastocystis sp. ATCC 50177/Nand II]